MRIGLLGCGRCRGRAACASLEHGFKSRASHQPGSWSGLSSERLVGRENTVSAESWLASQHQQRRRFASLLSNLPQRILDSEYSQGGATILSEQEHLARRSVGWPVGIQDEQVLSFIRRPEMLQKNRPALAKELCDRADRYIQIMGSEDAKSTQGARELREEVAKFMEKRDGNVADPGHIFLFEGGAAAARSVLSAVLPDSEDGLLLPLPQYPMWSSALAELTRPAAGYFLEESSSWGVSMIELDKGAEELQASSGQLRAVLVINPGNPAGQILSRAEMEVMLDFVEQNEAILIADEAQEGCLHDPQEGAWLSFRRVAAERGSKAQVLTVLTAGVGEPGLEGAAVHCQNMGKGFMTALQDAAAAALEGSPDLRLGQALIACVLAPLPEGSSTMIARESARNDLAADLKQKASMVHQRLLAIDGFTCQLPRAGHFIFPRVIIKGYVMKKAISFATPADQIYCMELAERQALPTMPGCGFGQRPGHFHFRLSLMQEVAELERSISTLEQFHKEHPGGWFE